MENIDLKKRIEKLERTVHMMAVNWPMNTESGIGLSKGCEFIQSLLKELDLK